MLSLCILLKGQRDKDDTTLWFHSPNWDQWIGSRNYINWFHFNCMQRHTEIFQAKVVGKKDLEKPCIVIRTAILSCDEMVKLT